VDRQPDDRLGGIRRNQLFQHRRQILRGCTESDTHTNRNGYRNSDANAYSHSNPDAYSHSNTKADADSKEHTTASAATNSASAPVHQPRSLTSSRRYLQARPAAGQAGVSSALASSR